MGDQTEPSLLPLQEWMAKCDDDTDHRHLLCCSVAYRMRFYIVDRLFGSMLTNGSGSTAHLMGILLIYIAHPLQDYLQA